MWARWINVALGIWLMAAPELLRYGSPAGVNDQIVGPLVLSFAVIGMSEATRSWRYVNVLLGAWLILAPSLLGYSETFNIVNDMVVGVAIALLTAVRGKITQQFGGGWSSLWRKKMPGQE